MRIRIYCILAMLWPVFACYCQNSSKTIHPLAVGDTIPGDLELSNIYHYPVSKIRFSDLKDKLVILDFWATWCGSCINEFAKLEELYKKYKGKIEIIAVSIEDKDEIKKFLKTNKKAAKTTFPFLTNDSLLSSFFPHKLVPHEVWIDSNNRVYKITDASYVTEDNINSYFGGKYFQSVQKNDLLNYHKSNPLLRSQNDEIEKRILRRSGVFRFLGAGTRSTRMVDSLSGLITLKFTDMPILNLYWIALQESTHLQNLPRRTILHVKNQGKYILSNEQSFQWYTENCFCYEISTSNLNSDSLIASWMLKDLNIGFNLNGRIENRQIAVWILKLKNEKLLTSKGGTPIENPDYKVHSISLRNEPVERLVNFLNIYTTSKPNCPIISQIRVKGNIDINLSVRENCTFSELKKLLGPFGIAIVEKKMWMKVFVLSEN